MVKNLPNGLEYRIISRQLIRSGTSAGANYRSACRARSTADFIGKLKIVEEELDETLYWLEMLNDLFPVEKEVFAALHREGTELVSIIVTSIKTTRQKHL